MVRLHGMCPMACAGACMACACACMAGAMAGALQQTPWHTPMAWPDGRWLLLPWQVPKRLLKRLRGCNRNKHQKTCPKNPAPEVIQCAHCGSRHVDASNRNTHQKTCLEKQALAAAKLESDHTEKQAAWPVLEALRFNRKIIAEKKVTG